MSKLKSISTWLEIGKIRSHLREISYQYISSIFGILLTLFFTQSAGAQADKPSFFANKEACIASDRFNNQECAQAFENAKLQVLDRAEEYSSLEECRLTFFDCEIAQISEPENINFSQAIEEKTGEKYIPTLLGVEIINNQFGPASMPILSKDNPSNPFTYISLSEKYTVRNTHLIDSENKKYGDIRQTDHFEQRPHVGGTKPTYQFKPSSVHYAVSLPPNIGKRSLSDEVNIASASVETPEERRERIRNAPIVY